MSSEKISRRNFIAGGASLAAVTLFVGRKQLAETFRAGRKITGSIVGANAAAGHLLREFKFGEPVSTENEKIVIIGSGVSGLSAARWLSKKGWNDYTLLELGDAEGGNSTFGSNEVSAYPWGAHYLPIPDSAMTEIIEFLQECGSITGFDEAGLPVYNEYHLCAEPEERLFIHGTWQEGIIPEIGLTEDDKFQIQEFLRLMHSFRQQTGSDGKSAFAIPVSNCSEDEDYRKLDKIPMSQFLQEHHFSSKYLIWYMDYCCRDDYGTTLEKTSAWAGIHYFASRKGRGANAEYDDVLTWPEGNGFLVKKLMEQTTGKIKTRALVYSVELLGDKVKILYHDVRDSSSKCILADKVILATPQFVNNRILKFPERKIDASHFSYSPWMVANITLSELRENSAIPLCWDNVIYGSSSLGYVNACHQHLSVHEKKKVVTYYLPLTDAEPKEERQKAFDKTYKDWVEIILSDMEKAHRDIENKIEHIDVWLWGHGMVRPVPGFITGEERKQAMQPVADKLFFAHSDLSGLSIFEEAFFQGIRAANEVLQTVQKS